MKALLSLAVLHPFQRTVLAAAHVCGGSEHAKCDVDTFCPFSEGNAGVCRDCHTVSKCALAGNSKARQACSKQCAFFDEESRKPDFPHCGSTTPCEGDSFCTFSASDGSGFCRPCYSLEDCSTAKTIKGRQACGHKCSFPTPAATPAPTRAPSPAVGRYHTEWVEGDGEHAPHVKHYERPVDTKKLKHEYKKLAFKNQQLETELTQGYVPTTAASTPVTTTTSKVTVHWWYFVAAAGAVLTLLCCCPLLFCWYRTQESATKAIFVPQSPRKSARKTPRRTPNKVSSRSTPLPSSPLVAGDNSVTLHKEHGRPETAAPLRRIEGSKHDILGSPIGRIRPPNLRTIQREAWSKIQVSCPDVQLDLASGGNIFRTPNLVTFYFDSSEVVESDEDIIKQFAFSINCINKSCQAHGYSPLVYEVRAFSSENDSKALQLSYKRAATFVYHLTRNGVDPTLVHPAAQGYNDTFGDTAVVLLSETLEPDTPQLGRSTQAAPPPDLTHAQSASTTLVTRNSKMTAL